MDVQMLGFSTYLLLSTRIRTEDLSVEGRTGFLLVIHRFVAIKHCISSVLLFCLFIEISKRIKMECFYGVNTTN